MITRERAEHLYLERRLSTIAMAREFSVHHSTISRWLKRLGVKIRVPSLTAMQRFDAKYHVDDESGCWLWDATKNRGGYGNFKFHGHMITAHRWRWERQYGTVPSGLELDHLCRTPHCVNPGHLEAVTHRENSLRGNSPHAQNARKTHCKWGHPLAGGNLYLSYRNGFPNRQCRTCRRRRVRKCESKRGRRVAIA